ncbi:Ig-like domain-containing protein [Candidatus Saccharibacteria bacterium]|nr:Ig-like domain-containing protein [Candidatus Saccharibacteria bacterium]
MKKLIIYLTAILTLSLVPVFTYAEKAPYEASSNDACSIAGFNDPLICGTGESNEEQELQKRIKRILETVYLWIGIIAVIVIVIGGIRYMTSTGEAEKIKGAKHAITYAIIGLVVTLAAFAITEFVIGALEGRAPEGGGTHAEGGGGSGGDSGGGGGSGGGSEGGEGGGSSDSEEVPVKSLSMPSKTTLVIDKTMQLKIVILPDYATDKTLTFSSEDSNIASVSNTGLITAKKEGETTITAKAKSGVTASIRVTVTKPVEASNITLEPTSATIKIGKTVTIKATISPKNAADKTITWSTSDKNIATVTNGGKVKGIKEGSATITATAKNGVKATAKITVEPNVTKYDPVQKQLNYKHSNGHNLDYWLNVPKGATSGMPLVIFLHGDGEVNRPAAVKNLKQVKYMMSSTKFISLAPVTKTTDWRSSHIQLALKGLIDKTIADYKSDTKRIYVWGFSRGAIGTWHIVNRYPKFFAAAVPVSCCGGGTTASNFKTTKIWALVGGLESDYKHCMKSLVNSINNAGGSAKYTELGGQTHGSMSGAINYPEVVDNWMLKQHR